MPQHWDFETTSAIAPHPQHGPSGPTRNFVIQALPIQALTSQGAKL